MGVNVVIFTDCMSHGSLWSRTAGTYRVASELRSEGYTVQVIDHFSSIVLEGDELLWLLLHKFIGPETLWVGFSTTFLNNLQNLRYGIDKRGLRANRRNQVQNVDDWSVVALPRATRIINKVKSINPRVKIAVGGARVRRDFDLVDAVFFGYADRSAVEYTKFLRGKNPFFQGRRTESGQFIVDYDPKGEQFNFQSSKITWEESDCVLPGEALPIEVSRGCIFRCKYCSYPLNGKTKNDYIKHGEALEEEFLTNYERWGTTRYVFSDDTYNDTVAKLEHIDSVVRKLPFKLEFGTYARLDLIEAFPEQIDLLESNGLRSVFFGIESLNQRAARSMGKGGNTEKLINLLYLLRERWGDRIHTNSGFIFGLPHDTVESMNEWGERVMDHRFPLHSFSFAPLGINDPARLKRTYASELDSHPEKYGYTFPDPSDHAYWENEELGTNFYMVDKMVSEYLAYAGAIGRITYPAQLMMTVMNLGYSLEEIRKHTRAGLDLAGSELRTRSLFLDYAHKLLNL